MTAQERKVFKAMREALLANAKTLANCHSRATQMDHDLAFCDCAIAVRYRQTRAALALADKMIR